MSTELPKAYEPAAVEAEAIRVWTDENCFHAEPTDPGEPYSIVIPPPNVTAALHLGHALNNTLQDILTRVHRMKGNNTEWIPGTDHAGIATQTVVDKRLQAEGQPALKEYKLKEAAGQGGRDQFIEKVQAWKDDYEGRITEQLKRMGCSCDWDRQAFTMDEPRAKAVREAFFQLFKDGLIYRGKRLVNWDPVTQTALADDEVENEEIDGFFYYLRYPLSDGSGHVTVATTRPETMLGDTAVAINPKDPRAAELKGKKVRLPLVGRTIKIIEDDYVVLPVGMGGDANDTKAQFATGFLKVTPAHDPNDYEIGKRHDLPVINVMAPDASISDKHGWPAVGQMLVDEKLVPNPHSDINALHEVIGKSREEARTYIVAWFEKNGLLEEVKPYRHSVGHSYRSHAAIEPYLSDQWYCKVTDDKLRGAALRSSKSGAVKFFPDRYSKTFDHWHENIRDWCISRQLWWGHRIPVWALVDESTKVVWGDEAEKRRFHLSANRMYEQGRIDFQNRPLIDAPIEDYFLTQSYVCVRDPNDREAIELIEEFGFRQDPDVLDTWFSSGLWPLSTLGWPSQSPDLEKWNPTSVLCTAREIITLWVSRMVMFNCYFRDCVPFRDVFIHAMIQDGHGQKMSKSLGNGVDPLDIISTHGADAMRFTLATMATNTQDVKMPVDMIDPFTGETFTPKYVADHAGHTVAAPIQESLKGGKKFVSSYGQASGKAQPTDAMPVARNTSSKFDFGRNFCNKLWNASRFVLMNLEKHPEISNSKSPFSNSLADQWIVSRFNRTVADAEDALANYRFDQYAKACYDFFWRDFCDWYVEATKPAMRDPARAAQTATVLASVFDAALRLMHPVIPFITETIWWKLNDVRPARGLTNELDGAAISPRLVKAQWPTAGPVNDAAEQAFAKLQELIVAIRTMRNDHKVDPKKPVSVSIVAPDDFARIILAERDVLELLATCTVKQAGPDVAPIEKAARALVAGCEIFVEGIIDEEAESQRVEKRRVELTKSIAALKGRLSNESYLAKAPANLVQQTKDQLTEAETELAKL